RRVALRRKGSRKVLARGTVRADGTFVLRTKAPKRTAGVRYLAGVGGATSASVALRSRFAVSSLRIARGRVTFRGRVTRPFGRSRTVRVAVRTGCRNGRPRWKTVKTVRRTSRGAVTARFAAPKGQDVVVVRATAKVRSGRRTTTVATTPRAVAR
ncbi:hypothetical protein ACVU7I_19830, partial [Patulibacter sp. S7RM1-6]